MDFKLELVILPVADVDRAKAFYVDQAGFQLDVDHRAGGRRLPCRPADAVGLCVLDRDRRRITSADPGSVRDLHLSVDDIVVARDELVARGVEVGELHHFGSAERESGVHPERADYNSFAQFADPGGNVWLLQERGYEGGPS